MVLVRYDHYMLSQEIYAFSPEDSSYLADDMIEWVLIKPKFTFIPYYLFKIQLSSALEKGEGVR